MARLAEPASQNLKLRRQWLIFCKYQIDVEMMSKISLKIHYVDVRGSIPTIVSTLFQHLEKPANA